MLRRLPISLKFDDEDSDFYCGFIEPKKNDRELTTLILNLLHAYYEKEEIRNSVDEYILEQSPFLTIHKEIERIAMEHSKNTTLTKMAKDAVVNEQNNFYKTSEPTEQDIDVPEETKETQYLQLPESALKELEGLRKEVAGMSQLKEEMSKMQELLGQLVKSDKVVNQEVVAEEKKSVEKVKPQKPVLDSEAVQEKAIDGTEDKEPVKEEVVKTKKPKSFSKLMGSIE